MPLKIMNVEVSPTALFFEPVLPTFSFWHGHEILKTLFSSSIKNEPRGQRTFG